MKQLLSHLLNTIHQDFVISIISDEILIQENKKDAKCTKVILKSKKKQIFAFSLDNDLTNKCKVFPFFNQETALITKVNDSIIFYLDKGKIFILLIELKSNNLGDYKKQLEAGKVFVHFILGILNNAFAKNYVLDEENIKCLVFSLRKTERKQGSRRTSIVYEKINGLNIAEFGCNEKHYIEKFISKGKY
jgi:hypothetical protein